MHTLVDGRSPSVPPPSMLPPSMALPLLAGRFALTSTIGRGGMGVVYRARDTMLDEDVALKVLDGAVAPAQLAGLRTEVKLARRVTHPNVVRTFDMGMHQDTPFITMELVEGESLLDVLRREGPLPLPRFYPIARAICEGLAAAHAASVLHLDLKPANVLIGADGRIAVTDFGVACLAGSEVGSFAGTPAFMAPEQGQGTPVDERADVYSLGVVFFVALTGVLPKNATPSTTARVPQELALIVRRCIAEDRESRYATAAALLADLVRLAPAVEPRPAPASAPAVVRTPRSGGSSRRAITDIVAYERYTLGLLAYQKMWPEHAREAIAHFEVAIQRCPENATLLAASSLAHVRFLMGSGAPGLQRARELAARAVELEPELGHAQLAQAAVMMADGREVGAVEHLKEALTRAPWLAEAHARLGELFGDIGEIPRALAELELGHDFEPLAEDPIFRRAHLHALVGEIDKADALFGPRPVLDENINTYAWRRLRTILYAPTAARIHGLRTDLAPLDYQLGYQVDAVLATIESRQIPAMVEGFLLQMVMPAESPRRTWFYTLPFIDILGLVGRTGEALDQLEHADRHGLLDLTWLDHASTLEAVRSSDRVRVVRERVAARAERVRAAAVRAGLL